MSDINIKIDKSIIKTNLTSMITHPNKEAIINLIVGMLEENHQGSALFIEYLLGKSEIVLPAIGTVGKFKISDVWSSDKSLLEDSEFNLNGYVTCVISHHSSLHNYHPIKVDYPTVDAAGKKKINNTGLEVKQFLIDYDDFDNLNPF